MVKLGTLIPALVVPSWLGNKRGGGVGGHLPGKEWTETLGELCGWAWQDWGWVIDTDGSQGKPWRHVISDVTYQL